MPAIGPGGDGLGPGAGWPEFAACVTASVPGLGLVKIVSAMSSSFRTALSLNSPISAASAQKPNGLVWLKSAAGEKKPPRITK